MQCRVSQPGDPLGCRLGYSIELGRGGDAGWKVLAVLAYSALVSLAFIIVNILLTTHGSFECSDTVSGYNYEVKRLVHMHFLNMDKSINGDDITDQVVDADEDAIVIAARKHYSVRSRLLF